MIVEFSLAFSIGHLAGNISGSSCVDISGQGTYFLSYANCLYTFASSYITSGGSASSFVLAGVLCRSLGTIFGDGSFPMRNIVGPMSYNSAVTSDGGDACFAILARYVGVLCFFFRSEGGFV